MSQTRIALITAVPGSQAGLRAELEARGFRVACHGDAWSFLQSARHRKVCLAILDGIRRPFRPMLQQLVEADPALPLAVLSDLDPGTFEAETDGFGLLGQLSAHPAPAELERVLAQLRATGGLDPAVEAAQARLDALKAQRHPHCVVCWDRHPFGLGIDYCATGPDTVEGTFDCGKSYEGYENMIHGGIISSLLDGAMVSCLLARGLEGYTADLRVRYRAPVGPGAPALIRGAWLGGRGPLHRLQATLEQGGRVCASARAIFLQKPPAARIPRPANPDRT